MMAAVPPVARRVCTVCCQQAAQYICPRCHKPYCSSACYKRHGQQCTESFYREQATNQMKSTVADKQQQQHMMLILQRLHEQGQLDGLLEHDADDDDDSNSNSDDNESEESESDAALQHMPALKQLLKRATRQGDTFDIEPTDITPELLAELEQLSLGGHLSHLVTPWQPWWNTQAAAELQLNAAGQRVIAELVQQEQQQATSRADAQQGSVSSRSAGTAPAARAALPAPPAAPLPSLKALAGPKFQLSPLLPWQLLQLLMAYCAVLRLYNGEPDSSDSWEAAELLLQLAPPLSQLLAGPGAAAGNPQQQQQAEPQAVAAPESLRSACMQLSAAASELSDVAGGPTGQKAVLRLALSDAGQLLQLGRSTVLLALTDSKRILDDSTHSLKFQIQSHQPTEQQQVLTSRREAARPGDKQTRLQLRQLKQRLKLAAHKLTFFSVWCNEQAPELYESLAAELVAELQEQQQVSGAAGGAQAAPISALVVGARQAAQQAEVLSAQPAVVPLDKQEPLTVSKQPCSHGQDAQGLDPAENGAERVDPVVTGGAAAMVLGHNGGGLSDQGGRGHERQVVFEAGKHSVCRGGGNAAAVVADSTSSLYDLD